jgi:hypothetical protein
MTIELLQKCLTKVKEMKDAGIEIPENLLQAIDSLAGQLEPFLKDSSQKGEFDAMEKEELIIKIFFLIWEIFYDDFYQQILLEHEKLREIVGDVSFDKDYSVGVRKEDIRIRMIQIHYMLVRELKSPIPPPIENICLPPSLLTHNMLKSFEGENPKYGYQEEPSLAQDRIPNSFEEYVEYQIENVDHISDWFDKCLKFRPDDKVYDFLCNPLSDIALRDEAMKKYGSMPYNDIIRLLTNKYCYISEHFSIDN